MLLSQVCIGGRRNRPGTSAHSPVYGKDPAPSVHRVTAFSSRPAALRGRSRKSAADPFVSAPGSMIPDSRPFQNSAFRRASGRTLLRALSFRSMPVSRPASAFSDSFLPLRRDFSPSETAAPPLPGRISPFPSSCAHADARSAYAKFRPLPALALRPISPRQTFSFLSGPQALTAFRALAFCRTHIFIILFFLEYFTLFTVRHTFFAPSLFDTDISAENSLSSAGIT